MCCINKGLLCFDYAKAFQTVTFSKCLIGDTMNKLLNHRLNDDQRQWNLGCQLLHCCVRLHAIWKKHSFRLCRANLQSLLSLISTVNWGSKDTCKEKLRALGPWCFTVENHWWGVCFLPTETDWIHISIHTQPSNESRYIYKQPTDQYDSIQHCLYKMCLHVMWFNTTRQTHFLCASTGVIILRLLEMQM